MNIYSCGIKTREIEDAEERSRLVINLDFLPLLEEEGLVSFADFFHYPGGELIKRIPDRTVTRISLGQEGHFFYLKRHLLERHSPWQRFSTCPKHVSEGAVEFDNCCLFRAHGLATALPVAMGEREIAGSKTQSFLITQDFAPLLSLEDIIRNSPHLLVGETNRGRRQRLLFAAADYARRMHQSGFNHQDYNATHILLHEHDLDTQEQAMQLAVFDLQRVATNRFSAWRWPIKSLAELNYTLPEDLFGKDERLILLKSYLGTTELTLLNRLLWRAILAKTIKISRHAIKRRARRQRAREKAST